MEELKSKIWQSRIQMHLMRILLVKISRMSLQVRGIKPSFTKHVHNYLVVKDLKEYIEEFHCGLNFAQSWRPCEGYIIPLCRVIKNVWKQMVRLFHLARIV